MKNARYDNLIAREGAHWGALSPSPANPQIWEDERLFAIFFGREYFRMISRVCEHGPRVLELGCGNGGLAIALAERGLNVVGIDLSRERVSTAKREARQRGVEGTTSFQVGDLNVLPLPPQSFECIVAHDSLHHILELDSLLERASAALVPGGALIVMDFVGMGTFRKVLAAGLFAILPTFQPYKTKWALRGRLRSFLASEGAKRRGMDRGSTGLLNPESPFEEISGDSIPRLVESHFRVEEYRTFLPFWYYFAPKLRLPGKIRLTTARVLHALDSSIVKVVPRSGAYIFIVARHRENQP